MIIAISVVQCPFAIGLVMEIRIVSSATFRFNLQILFMLASCIFTTYLVTAITRLIGQRNFFKISRKLLSVGSFVNYREGAAFSNAVIALHVILFGTYLIRYLFEFTIHNCRLELLHILISGLVCDTVTSFAALQFLYFVFTLRRHFMMLNRRLNEVMMSTVKAESILSLEFRKVPDFYPERYSVISGVRDILYRHVMLCDILELINSSYSLQILALIGLKFVCTTIFLYLLFLSVFDRFLLPFFPFPYLIPLVSVEVMQLVTVLYCCQSACLQVSII